MRRAAQVPGRRLGGECRCPRALAHIAEQLEPFGGGVLLSADAVQQIRAALLEVLQHSGSGMDREDDPDLSPGIGLYAQELERQLRAAIQLLDPVAGRAAA